MYADEAIRFENHECDCLTLQSVLSAVGTAVDFCEPCILNVAKLNIISLSLKNNENIIKYNCRINSEPV